VVIPVSDKFVSYARSVHEELLDGGIRAEANLKDDRVGYKIREASLRKLPYSIVVGEKEQTAGTINLRSRDRGELGEMPIPAFLESILEEIAPGRQPRAAE